MNQSGRMEEVDFHRGRAWKWRVRALAAEAELERAKKEIAYTHDRGDHLVYRHEWEAFDAWQRSQS